MNKESGLRIFNTLKDAYRNAADRKRVREYLDAKDCYLTTTNRYPNGGLEYTDSFEFKAENQITGGLKALSLKKDGAITFKAYEMMNDEMAFEIFETFVHNMLTSSPIDSIPDEYINIDFDGIEEEHDPKTYM